MTPAPTPAEQGCRGRAVAGCSCPGTTPTVGRSSPRYSSGRGTKGGLYGPCSQHPRGGPGLEWAAHTGSKPLGTAGEELLGWLGGSFVVSGDQAGEEAAGLGWAPGGTVPSLVSWAFPHTWQRGACVRSQLPVARGGPGQPSRRWCQACTLHCSVPHVLSPPQVRQCTEFSGAQLSGGSRSGVTLAKL